MSVGYCPDFLDDDIDAIIGKLTLHPPPSVDPRDNQEPADADILAHIWSGPITDSEYTGMEFENGEMSETIDLGSFSLDEQYSSLIIPPPPDESLTVQDIPIVPPIESVKEKRKLFDKNDSQTYLESFANQCTSEGKTPSVVTQDKKGVTKESKIVSHDDKENINTNVLQTDNSPASVSEKLNALLKSLSSYSQEEEEALGHFRRTSSLRLGRSSSLDVLSTMENIPITKHTDLVTGSVRVKPKIRPKLSIERPVYTDHVAIPLKTASLDRAKNNTILADNNNTQPDVRNTSSLKVKAAHSLDVLPTGTAERTSSEGENVASESFASLKAKLQSYRDTLLNRSLRRKKKVEADKCDADRASLDGDVREQTSPLTRSNSFSSLIRRSLGRAAGRELKKSSEGRLSSATRASKVDEIKTDGKEGMKDKKYWNTLTTPRSNFRPNTGSSVTQVII